MTKTLNKIQEICAKIRICFGLDSLFVLCLVTFGYLFLDIFCINALVAQLDRAQNS